MNPLVAIFVFATAAPEEFGDSMMFNIFINKFHMRTKFHRLATFMTSFKETRPYCFLASVMEEEKRAITEDLYEEYHSDTDTYTFTIV